MGQESKHQFTSRSSDLVEQVGAGRCPYLAHAYNKYCPFGIEKVTVKLNTRTPKSPARSSAMRDAEHTRNAILDAAEEEFARSGLSGARTDAIASLTGVTKAMIYYYFSSKEALYQAVLERAFSSKIAEIEHIVESVREPEQALRAILDYFLSHAEHNPTISGILFHEAMQNKGKYYKSTGMLTLYEKLAQVLHDGIESGAFREVDPMHTAVNIIGLSAFYFCANENLKHLWPGRSMLSPAMVEQHKQEATKLVLAGVLAKNHCV
jgi:TetR/AcrR family transcriptional regulator